MIEEAAATDWITNLPDPLIHHILSFLEIKDGACTSVLSKRWNYIWTTVPELHFVSLAHNSIPTSSETEKFMGFVDGTLHRHNSSNVEKFFLLCNHQLNENRLHTWISTVIRGNVKELGLCLCQDDPLFIPLSLFTCASLVSLELATHPDIRLPKYVSFPSLKSLSLGGFMFSDDCWNEELFSNSPVLEELILEHCAVNMKLFCISIPTLKVLQILTSRIEGTGIQECTLKIHAPSLVTFTYVGDVAKEYVLSGFPKLEEAVICLYSRKDDVEEIISRLLEACAHVKSLSVSDLILQVMDYAHCMLNIFLTFHNVTKLNISEMPSSDEGLIALLRVVPNLESLVFYEYFNDEEKDEDDEDNAEGDSDAENQDSDADSGEGENSYENEDDINISSTKCNINDEVKSNYYIEDYSWTLNFVTNGALVFPHLKSVCFQKFLGNPREMRWMKLILRNSKALQVMTICYYDALAHRVKAKSEKEVTVEIPSFPRASTGCVFKFYSQDGESII